MPREKRSDKQARADRIIALLKKQDPDAGGLVRPPGRWKWVRFVPFYLHLIEPMDGVAHPLAVGFHGSITRLRTHYGAPGEL